jgi:hypothetical protein
VKADDRVHIREGSSHFGIFQQQSELSLDRSTGPTVPCQQELMASHKAEPRAGGDS